MICVLTGSNRFRKYWSDLKNEGFEVSEKIGQLKLKSQDGKYRLIDVADIEDMFKIIESISSKNADKKWTTRYSNWDMIYNELNISYPERLN